jgi:hypothetical protein
MENEIYHAIIVNESLKDKSVLDKLKIIGTKKGGWTLYKIEVLHRDIDGIIKLIRSSLNDGEWYFHFYNIDGSKLAIVYKDKTYLTNNDKDNWKDATEHGKGLNIPKEQLDFVPNQFEDEKF